MKKRVMNVTVVMALMLCMLAALIGGYGKNADVSSVTESASVTPSIGKVGDVVTILDTEVPGKITAGTEDEGSSVDEDVVGQTPLVIPEEIPSPTETTPPDIQVEGDSRLDTSERVECDEVVYTNTTSNIRLQPSTSADKVGTVNKNTELKRNAVLSNGWSEIEYNGQTCYISSKLLSTEPIANVEPVQKTDPVNDNPVPEAPAPAPTTATANGTTRTFSNGEVFVARGQTPGGLTIWYMQSDNGTWPDYMIAAYDACGVTNDMSDYDKAVTINNYICRTVEYAGVGSDDRALYSACLSYGKAECGGYAHAFDCLCTMAGVYSNQVAGTSYGGASGVAAHVWNYVLIGDTKYWVDVCWNDGTNNAYLMSTTQFSDHVFSYEY